MHTAFRLNQKMRVKIGNILSEEMPVTSGTVQGRVLGVLDPNAVFFIFLLRAIYLVYYTKIQNDILKCNVLCRKK